MAKYGRDITFDEYKLSVLSEEKELETFVSQLESVDVSEEVLSDLIKRAVNQSLAHDLALLSIDVSEGRKDVSEVLEFYNKFDNEIVEEEESEYLSTDIEEILEHDINLPGLNWRLDCLNKSLGPLRKGNFGHIFARIETGKTAMWISEVTHMLPQLKEGETLAIFFNEENGRDVILRMYSALLHKTYAQILASPKEAKEEFLRKGGNKIRFYDRASLDRKEIESIVKKINPGLIVIDNMDKMSGFNADRNDLVLWEIYKWGRKLAKEWCPVLSVGQADVTANNQKWVNEAQMDGGKTGKPSETDFALGIGRIQKEGYEYVRYLYLSRNKLKGGKDTLAKYRHGKFEVIINPEYSIYEDINIYN